MHKFVKYGLWGIGGIIAINVIRYVTDDGLAKTCVAYERAKYFVTMLNGCDEPVNATVCREWLLVGSKCTNARFARRQQFGMAATDDASIPIQIIVGLPTVFACKTGFKPVLLPNEQYRCERGEVGFLQAF